MAVVTNKNEYSGVVVITGASAGVGRATVRCFAQQKYKIGLIARGKEGLEAAVEEVKQMGGEAVYYIADVANANEIDAAATYFEERLGEITIWVNNAMTSVFSPVNKMKAEEYKRVTDVTYIGQVNGALSALKRMEPRNKGSIVFVGSALAYRGIPLQSAYCGAKHATKGFVDSLRTELIHNKSKISISMVQLPALNTTQFGFVKSRLDNKPRPMGKIYQPEVAARAILYAAEHTPKELMVGWSTVKAIIGNKIAPWYADRVLGNTAVEGQQTNEVEDPDRKHNLWQPLPGDHGSHGNFDKQAKSASLQFWLSRHKKMVLVLIFLLVIAVLSYVFLS